MIRSVYLLSHKFLKIYNTSKYLLLKKFVAITLLVNKAKILYALWLL